MTILKTKNNRRLTIIEFIKPLSLFVFLSFQPLYELLKTITGLADFSHILLILLCFAPLALAVFLDREKLSSHIAFLVFIFLVFSFYFFFGKGSLFYGDEYALPSMLSFFGGVIGFNVLLAQDNPTKTKVALKLSVLVLSFYLLLFYSPSTSNTYAYGYDMYYGYQLALPAVFCISFAFEKKRSLVIIRSLFWVCLLVLLVLALLTYGSRGPFLCLITFAFIKVITFIFLDKSVAKRTKILFVSLSCFVLILVLVYLNSFLRSFGQFLYDQGINSRTISRFLSNSLTFDNGRGMIIDQAIGNVSFLGHGPFSDQYYFGEGNYCHNLFVELVFDFGVFGVVMIVFLAVAVATIIFRFCNSAWYDLFLVTMSFSLSRLFVSGTFWTETVFWMFLATIVMIFRNQPKDRMVGNFYENTCNSTLLCTVFRGLRS